MLLRSICRPRLLLGEWAGWCCSFDGRSGMVQPVPDQFVTEEMREWEHIPNGFEEFATEAWLSGDGLGRRRTVRILPEVGCNIENLPALVSHEVLPEAPVCKEGAWASDTLVRGSMWRCETVFHGLGGVRPRARRDALPGLAERTRVTVFFDAAQGALHDGELIVIRQERLWSEQPTLELNEASGSRSGLDGAWVSSAVGLACFGDMPSPVACDAAVDGLQRQTLPGGVTVVAAGDGSLDVLLQDPQGHELHLRRRWAVAAPASLPEVQTFSSGVRSSPSLPDADPVSS